VGRDSKGRTTRLYSAEHSGRQSEQKFTRLKAFDADHDRMAGRIRQDAEKGSEEACVLYLIDQTGFRVGSDRETGAKEKAFGASTLTADQAKVDGNRVAFDFTGKKGVHIQKTVEDPLLARIISGHSKGHGRLFATSDGKVRDYLHSIDGKFKVKDFRTWQGTQKALETLVGMTPPRDDKEAAKQRREVGKVVSEHLGNTPAVALASYIAPSVFAVWEEGLR